jgi:hypothetical protein
VLVESVILGIVIGIVQNGRITNIGITHIRGWYMIPVAFFLGISPMFSINSPFFEDFGSHIFFISLLMMFGVLLWNLDKKGFWIIAIGAGLNIVTIMLNHFRMPIYMEGLRIAGLESMINGIESGEIINYVSMESLDSWLRFLGKLIVLPKPYPLPKLISVGDLLMSLGIIFYLRGEMLKKYRFSRSRMVTPRFKAK